MGNRDLGDEKPPPPYPNSTTSPGSPQWLFSGKGCATQPNLGATPGPAMAGTLHSSQCPLWPSNFSARGENYARHGQNGLCVRLAARWNGALRAA
eukprot:3089437-Lingulodinium_polyedra.AAC.1